MSSYFFCYFVAVVQVVVVVFVDGGGVAVGGGGVVVVLIISRHGSYGRYPFEPPQMRFLTKIWHPNISSQTGAICLDILKDAWSPALTIKTALLSIQALLSAAEPTDPQDAEVAKMYLHDQKQFLNTARFWTESYAKQKDTGDHAALSRLIDMGFPSVWTIQLLSSLCCGGSSHLVCLWTGQSKGCTARSKWRRECCN